MTPFMSTNRSNTRVIVFFKNIVKSSQWRVDEAKTLLQGMNIVILKPQNF